MTNIIIRVVIIIILLLYYYYSMFINIMITIVWYQYYGVFNITVVGLVNPYHDRDGVQETIHIQCSPPHKCTGRLTQFAIRPYPQ